MSLTHLRIYKRIANERKYKQEKIKLHIWVSINAFIFVTHFIRIYEHIQYVLGLKQLLKINTQNHKYGQQI